MEKKEQVFLYMKEEIERLAKIEEDKYLEEAKAVEEEVYQQLEAEAKNDAKVILDRELAEITSDASVESSSTQEEKTKKLVDKRDEYVSEVFNQAKNKLVEFTTSNDYHEYMMKKVKEIGDLYKMDNSVLYLKDADLSIGDELKNAYGLDIEVKANDTIKIGGFIVENKETNVVVDETLDFALENQKEWFYNTSGLMIK